VNESQVAPFWPTLQHAIGCTLRLPLSRVTSNLVSNLGALDTETAREFVADERGSIRERLGIYNRQYWFRLFSVMQQEFPILAHLLGYWEFNGWAAQFLQFSPPRTADIGDIGNGFVEFLRLEVPRRNKTLTPNLTLISQAADVDEAYRRIIRAPPVVAWRPSPTDVLRIAKSSLQAAANLAFVKEDWPLVELRDAFEPDSKGPIDVRPLNAPKHWAIMRVTHGMGRVQLQPDEYELFVAIQNRPLSTVLAELQRQTSSEDIPTLSIQVNHWLTRSMKLGFWTGLKEPHT
jgi:Putative DNA-binding domain